MYREMSAIMVLPFQQVSLSGQVKWKRSGNLQPYLDSIQQFALKMIETMLTSFLSVVEVKKSTKGKNW